MQKKKLIDCPCINGMILRARWGGGLGSREGEWADRLCLPVRVKYSPSQGQAHSQIHLHRQAVRSAGNSSVGKSMRWHEAAAASSTASRHFVVMRVRCLLLELHSRPSCFSRVSSSHRSPPPSPLLAPLKRNLSFNKKKKSKEGKIYKSSNICPKHGKSVTGSPL